MARIASLVLLTLSLFLGMFFAFIGLIKLSPALNMDIHREIRRSFVRYAKVVPVVSQLGWKVSPKLYRLTIGWIEIMCGLMLAFLNDRIKLAVNVFLFSITIGAIYTHSKVGDEIDKMYPAMAFTGLLLSRLALYFMVRKQRLAELKLDAHRKSTELSRLSITPHKNSTKHDKIAKTVQPQQSQPEEPEKETESVSPLDSPRSESPSQEFEVKRSTKRKRRRNKNKEKVN